MQYTSTEHGLKSGGGGGVSPFSKHSFSQAASWSGGGVMKMILSLDTPIDTRYLTMPFKFSENSWRGTCCAGFLSVKEKKVSHISPPLLFRDDAQREIFLPSKAQSLAPKKTVTAAIGASEMGTMRGSTILAHLVLYPDKPLFTTSHFLINK